jgi:uncharacterized repeat protein (TIGR01451 family)
VTEAETPVAEDGSSRVTVKQPLPAPGTNRIGIEVVKPDHERPGRFTVVSKGETRIIWQAPQFKVTISAPATLGLHQDTMVAYGVTGPGIVEAAVVTLTARLPDGIDLIGTEPKAAVDGNTLIWTLPATGDGKQPSVQAVVRPNRVGPVTLAAEARTEDGVGGRASVPVNVTEAKLQVKLDGPTGGLVGEALPFRVTVTNSGDGPAERIRVQAKLDDGLEPAGKSSAFDETIGSLAPGQSKTIPLPLSSTRRGKLAVQVGAAGERGGPAVPQTATVDVKEAQLALTAHGPAREYVGREVTWQLVVRNNGDVPLGNTTVKASLPPEVSFVRATDGGKVAGKQVVWDLGRAPPRPDRAITVTGICNNVSARTVLTATATATPVVEPDGSRRTASVVKPVGPARPAEAALEIVGLPALQMSVKDSADPVGIGQRTTYVVRVKNAGTQAARAVRVTAEMPRTPRTMRLTRATGPGPAGKIADEEEKDSFTVTFPALDSLAPNAEATFVIEAEALMPGDVRVRFEARSASQAQPLHAEETTKVLRADSRPSDR